MLTLICPNNHIYTTSFEGFRKAKQCRQCFAENNYGENSPHWKGGLTRVSGYLRDRLDNWIKESIKYYDNCCFITGKYSNDLTVHHPYNFKNIVYECFSNTKIKRKRSIYNYSEEELMLLTNECLLLHGKYGYGVPMIKSVHKLFHKINKYFNNTWEQLLDFKNKYQGEVMKIGY